MELKRLEIQYNSVNLQIPYWEIKGKSEGKKIFITAGIHGDEVNGIEAVRQISEFIVKNSIAKELIGTLYLLPILNPSGFREGLRRVPEDGKDLNRQFGKQSIESISQAVATRLTDEILSKCDLGIDFHDAGSGSVFIPHARIHMSDEDDCISCTRELARVFGTRYLLERKGVRSMMAVALNNLHNTPVITVEIGGFRTLHSETESIAIKGFLNVLRAYQMIPGEIELPESQTVVRFRRSVVTPVNGVIKFFQSLGQNTHEGDLIAEVYDPFNGTVTALRSPKDGIIFSVWPNNHIKKGRVAFSVVCIEQNDTYTNFSE